MPEAPSELTEPYWTAWVRLHRARPPSFSSVPAPISVESVLAYCELLGITNLEERERLLVIVQHVDASYREWSAAKVKAPEQDPNVEA